MDTQEGFLQQQIGMKNIRKEGRPWCLIVFVFFHC